MGKKARKMPNWLTPSRKAYLAALYSQYLAANTGWLGDVFSGEFYHPELEQRARKIVGYWVADDRAENAALWRKEQKAIHSLAEKGPVRGEFSAIARDCFHDAQPEFYLLGLGMSGLTFRPFAKVRLASSYIHLYVDLGDTLRKVGKVKRRKAIRYGKALPLKVQAEVDSKVGKAVRHFHH